MIHLTNTAAIFSLLYNDCKCEAPVDPTEFCYIVPDGAMLKILAKNGKCEIHSLVGTTNFEGIAESTYTVVGENCSDLRNMLGSEELSFEFKTKRVLQQRSLVRQLCAVLKARQILKLSDHLSASLHKMGMSTRGIHLDSHVIRRHDLEIYELDRSTFIIINSGEVRQHMRVIKVNLDTECPAERILATIEYLDVVPALGPNQKIGSIDFAL